MWILLGIVENKYWVGGDQLCDGTQGKSMDTSKLERGIYLTLKLTWKEGNYLYLHPSSSYTGFCIRNQLWVVWWWYHCKLVVIVLVNSWYNNNVIHVDWTDKPVHCKYDLHFYLERYNKYTKVKLNVHHLLLILWWNNHCIFHI